MTAGRAGNALSRHLPIAGWLPRYDRAWLRGDVAAGIAVTALVLLAAVTIDAVVRRGRLAT